MKVVNRRIQIFVGILIALLGYGALSLSAYSLYTGSYVYSNFDTNVANHYAQIAIILFCIWSLGIGFAGLRNIIGRHLREDGTELSIYITCILVAGFMNWVALKGILNELELEPFKAYVTEYLSGSSLNRSYSPYIKGKVVIVDKTERRISEILLGIPDKLRPTRPQDVGTIVWLECQDKKVGEYTDGADACVFVCKVAIIDRSIKAIVGEQSLRGADPPGWKRGRASRCGSFPRDEIINYLRSLPREQV